MVKEADRLIRDEVSDVVLRVVRGRCVVMCVVGGVGGVWCGWCVLHLQEMLGCVVMRHEQYCARMRYYDAL
jgi:hypothetical protein